MSHYSLCCGNHSGSFLHGKKETVLLVEPGGSAARQERQQTLGISGFNGVRPLSPPTEYDSPPVSIRGIVNGYRSSVHVGSNDPISGVGLSSQSPVDDTKCLSSDWPFGRSRDEKDESRRHDRVGYGVKEGDDGVKVGKRNAGREREMSFLSELSTETGGRSPPGTPNETRPNAVQATEKVIPSLSGRRRVFYKTSMCPWKESSRCLAGARCNYAHSLEELRDKPDFRETRLCQTYMNTGCCDSKNCSFAHGVDRLRHNQDGTAARAFNSHERRATVESFKESVGRRSGGGITRKNCLSSCRTEEGRVVVKNGLWAPLDQADKDGDSTRCSTRRHVETGENLSPSGRFEKGYSSRSYANSGGRQSSRKGHHVNSLTRSGNAKDRAASRFNADNDNHESQYRRSDSGSMDEAFARIKAITRKDGVAQGAISACGVEFCLPVYREFFRFFTESDLRDAMPSYYAD